MHRLNGWSWAVLLWITVIFFSSTSLASHWAEGTFGYVAKQVLGYIPTDSESFGLVHLIADKGFHVSLFCILAVLLWQVVPASGRKSWKIILGGAIVGSCSEFLQRFFPGRDPAIRDVFINIAGTALGVSLCQLLVKSRRRRRTKPPIDEQVETANLS